MTTTAEQHRMAEQDIRIWMRARGLRLVCADREAGLSDSAGSETRALALVAEWAAAPSKASGVRTANRLAAEGFALVDHWGETTLMPEEANP